MLWKACRFDESIKIINYSFFLRFLARKEINYTKCDIFRVYHDIGKVYNNNNNHHEAIFHRLGLTFKRIYFDNNFMR